MARLIRRFQGGDVESFGQIYSAYFDCIYRYLRVALSDEADAEDATQHVFTRALGALPEYRLGVGAPFRGWLFVIARRYAIDQLREADRACLVAPAEAMRHADDAAPADERCTLEGPFDWIDDRCLLGCVERLPLPQRQVLYLRYALDLKPAEIAVLLERSPADVRVLQHRALRSLCARINQLERGLPNRRDPVPSADGPNPDPITPA